MRFGLKRHLSAGLLAALCLTGPGVFAQSGGQPADPQAAVTSEQVGVNEKLGSYAALDLALIDEKGHPVSLKSLVDKPTILTLNYFRCSGICTPQLNGIAEVLNKVGSKPGKDFQVITVSFDPRDTPEMAAQKRINYLGQINRPFPPSAWRFLTGSAEATKTLADSVGYTYKKVGDGYIHAGAIMVLSPQGKITRYMYGITYLPADVDMAIQEAAKGEAQPSINKLLRFCFSYDPAGRKYVVNFTKLSMALTLVGAIVFGLVLAFKGRKKSKSEEGQ